MNEITLLCVRTYIPPPHTSNVECLARSFLYLVFHGAGVQLNGMILVFPIGVSSHQCEYLYSSYIPYAIKIM
jgi:hypothetical protein